MSGTRLRSRAAPVTDAHTGSVLLIVAHGERGGAGNDLFAHDLAREIQSLEMFADVRTCFISKEPTLKNVLRGLKRAQVLIYPMFMSDGYFVGQAIPRQISAAKGTNGHDCNNITVLEPLGLHRELPGLIASTAQQCIERSDLPASSHRLLLVAHGSRHDQASRQVTDAIAGDLRKMHMFADIETAFLEEAPFLEDQLRQIRGPAIAVGLFAGQGMHGGQDLPEAIAACGRHDISLAPPMAQWVGLPDLVQVELGAALAD